MGTLTENFSAEIHALLSTASSVNQSVIARVAPPLAASIAAGGIVHVFGSGHSEILAREMIGRAGALICVNAIADPTAGFVENLPGYGTRLVHRYARQYDPRAGEFALVISNSGKNCAPIEIALWAKQHGLRSIALSACAMAAVTASEHPDGRRLTEIADFVLDNGGIPGDARLDLPPPAAAGLRAAPTSTIVGAYLLNLLQLAVIDELLASGHQPPLLLSQNLGPDAMAANRKLAARYGSRLARVY